MEFFVDIADIEQVRRVAEYYPIDGFTTNPNILTKLEYAPEKAFREYRDYVRETGMKIFVQVTAEKAEDMFEQAKRLRQYFGENVVVKLPAVREGYKACRLCKEAGIVICVTVIHSAMQAILAAKAGADYVAPYITHIDNIGADGVACVEKMLRAFAFGGYGAKVLGASFRTVDQVERLANVGCHAVTVTPQFFDSMIAHPSTDASMNMFADAWKNRFEDHAVTDFLE